MVGALTCGRRQLAANLREHRKELRKVLKASSFDYAKVSGEEYGFQKGSPCGVVPKAPRLAVPARFVTTLLVARRRACPSTCAILSRGPGAPQVPH